MKWLKQVESEQALTLIVPRHILTTTYAHFIPYWRAGVETACYWYGVRAGELQVITTLGIPQLHQTKYHYQVVRESSVILADEMERQGLVNLAQIHTHPPDCSVDHSSFDDQHAYSTRQGALSLVCPDYGFSLSNNLTGIGVHERRDGQWVRLTSQEIASRIHVVDDIIDARWSISGGLHRGKTDWKKDHSDD